MVCPTDLDSAAVPPDVRRRLCLAAHITLNSLRLCLVRARRSRKKLRNANRKGTDFPHIRRHSRKETEFSNSNLDP